MVKHKTKPKNYYYWYKFWYNPFSENIYFVNYLLLIRGHINILESSILYFQLIEWKVISCLFFFLLTGSSSEIKLENKINSKLNLKLILKLELKF